MGHTFVWHGYDPSNGGQYGKFSHFFLIKSDVNFGVSDNYNHMKEK